MTLSTEQIVTIIAALVGGGGFLTWVLSRRDYRRASYDDLLTEIRDLKEDGHKLSARVDDLEKLVGQERRDRLADQRAHEAERTEWQRTMRLLLRYIAELRALIGPKAPPPPIELSDLVNGDTPGKA